MGKDAPHGGLLVLGADSDTLPCDGGTVTSPSRCAGGGAGGNSAKGAAILESGMDNSPMYYNAFADQPASYDNVSYRLQLYDVQQSALFVSESQALQALAVIDGGAAGELTHITTVRLNDAWLGTSAQSLEGRRHHANTAGGNHGRQLSPTGDRHQTTLGGAALGDASSSDGSVDIDNIGGRRTYGGPSNPKKLLQWPVVNSTSL